MRRVLEEGRGRGKSPVGVFQGFEGDESCKAAAGDAEGVRRAVDAAGAIGGGGGSSGTSVVIVLGECADYRQVRKRDRAITRGGIPTTTVKKALHVKVRDRVLAEATKTVLCMRMR